MTSSPPSPADDAITSGTPHRGRDRKTGFFDRFPEFYDSGNATPADSIRARLNARYEAIIENNLRLIRGKRILDLGSHDGSWSFAAIEAGANHVLGVEPRPELVDARQHPPPQSRCGSIALRVRGW